ncbi:MAG: hypothetical protein AWU57_561 [Marinobacter sp. T13-3]|nr:MAG: hypothetical protein AWU57_561 [Marinobacter sp. T13-3]
MTAITSGSHAFAPSNQLAENVEPATAMCDAATSNGTPVTLKFRTP